VLTNASGMIQNESDYFPYGGERVYAQALANQNYKFTGKERDSESGNDYFGARYFGSGMGRFLSSDPLPWVHWQHGKKNDQEKFAWYIANPQNFNLYAYVLNNLLNKTDPTGMFHINATGSRGCKGRTGRF
jgi:RHS repeat-associated protein